jgi:hypothetical protein
MPNYNEYYNFNFKLVYTNQIQKYNVNSNITVKNFIKQVKARVKNDFNLRAYEDVEIVEAGNPDNINGHDAELAPALVPSNTRIREIYGCRYERTSFYLRKIQDVVIDIPINIYVNLDEENYSNQEYIGEENV